MDSRAELDIDEQGREKLVWTVFDCHQYHLQAKPGDPLLVKDKMSRIPGPEMPHQTRCRSLTATGAAAKP